MMNTFRRMLLLATAALTLGGCVTGTPPTGVHQPMTARAEPRPERPPVTGAIYQAGWARPLFEDRRARYVGDTLTINIVEKTQASKTSKTAAERSQELSASVPTVIGLPGKGVQGLTLDASSSSTFAGKGDSDAKNDFTGTMTVTVIEVHPNGNLLVSGEKQVAINQAQEYIRFSGIVNPNYVTASNTVQSTQVADARIEYKAAGPLNDTQVMGWLARFFLTFLPL